MGLPFIPSGKPKFNLLKEIQKAGGGAYYDPSSLWGAADHLPRRNLLTYSEDFSNAAWVVANIESTNPTISANAAIAPDGTQTADEVTFGIINQTTDVSVIRQWPTLSVGTYTVSVYVKAKDANEVGKKLYLYMTSTTTYAMTLTSEWVRHSFTHTLATAGSQGINIASLGASYGGSNQTACVAYLWGAQLSLASTIDQSYQKITDWTTEQYAHAAAKNVPWLRRNYLIQTENTSNAFWTAVSSGNTASGNDVTFTGTGYRYSSTTVNIPVGTTLVASVVLSSSNKSTVGLRMQVGSAAPVSSITLTSTPTRYILSAATTTTGTSSFILGIDNRSGFGGDDVAGTVTATQWMVSASPSYVDYQPIGASWNAQYAANAAAAGVALTMYQDSAGTTAVSSPDQPIGLLADLAQGMSAGSELVTNGTFNTDTTGWTARQNATLSSVSGRLRITFNGTSYPEASQGITTVVGGVYTLSIDVVSSTATSCWVQLGTTAGGSQILNLQLAVGDNTTRKFVATSTTTYIGLYTVSTSGQYMDADNVSIKQVMGYHAIQSGATGLKPVLRFSPNGKWYLQRDLSDDNLIATFPNLGNNCVTYTTNGTAVTETTGVTLNGATNLNTPASDFGKIYLASPSSKRLDFIKLLNTKMGC